jgi:hypothetical protein
LTASQGHFAELADLACRIPTATVRRAVRLPAVAAARAAAVPRPGWPALFTKALAFVAGAEPGLRQLCAPWPRLRVYEHPFPVAAVLLERPFDEDVSALWACVTDPGRLGLQQLNAKFAQIAEEPAERVGQVRRLRRRNRWPWPVRRVLGWGEALRGFPWRARWLGTFAVASVGALGADLVDPHYPASAVLTYGCIDDGGTVDLSFKFDVRVLTPWAAARALQEVERALNCEIVMELRYFQALDAA